MRVGMIILLLAIVSCSQNTTDVNSSTEDLNSTEGQSGTYKFQTEIDYDSLSIYDLGDYVFKDSEYNKNSVDFKILHKNDIANFKNFILSDKALKGRQYPSGYELIDSIESIVGDNRFILELDYLSEGMGVVLRFTMSPPKTPQEYVSGITWVKVEEDYFSKIYENPWWQTGYDIYYNFGSLNLLPWEKKFIEKYNIDSLGLKIPHSYPEIDENDPFYRREQYDSLYFFREYPNKMLPVETIWQPKYIQIYTNWDGDNRYWGDIEINLGVSCVIQFVQNIDKERDYSFQEMMTKFDEFIAYNNYSELLEASPFTLQVSSGDLKQLDELYSVKASERYKYSTGGRMTFWEVWKMKEEQRERESNGGLSSACQCSKVLANPSEYGGDLVVECKRMYICWNNAYIDCLMNTSSVWHECVPR